MSAESSSRVDIGIVTFNTRELTIDMLGRLLRSLDGVDARILLHDNASADGTVDAVRAAYPMVEVERSESNLGFGAGMNRLLARSDASWFFALNSDAWPLTADSIATLVAAAQGQPLAAVVAPRLRRPSGQIEHSTYPFPSVSIAAAGAVGYGGARVGRQWGRRRMLHGSWTHDVAREVDWAVGAAWLMRRAVVDELGGFDESFFMYVEDLEWCWRVTQAGWRIWFEPAAEFTHVGNASGAEAFGSARSAAWVGNTYRFYRDRHGAASAMAYQAFNVLGAARAAVMATMRTGPTSARHWRTLARAHLAPARGSDRPPGESR